MLDLCIPIFVFVIDLDSDMNSIIGYGSEQDISAIEVSDALFGVTEGILRTTVTLNITS